MVDFGEPARSIDLEDYETVQAIGEALPASSIETTEFEEFTGERASWELPSPMEPDVPSHEAEFAAKHPNVYAAGKVFWGFLDSFRKVVAPTPEEAAFVGREITSITPFVKYLLPEERERFMQLNQQEQTRALLWDTLETALLFPASLPSAIKGLGRLGAPLTKGLGKLKKMVKPGFQFRPVEDIVLKEAEPFYREIEAAKLLKKKKLTDEEIRAVLDDNLLGFYRTKMHRGEPISSALGKEVRWTEGRFTLSPKLEGQLEEGALRARHYRKQWGRIVGSHLGKDYEKGIATKVFNAQVAETLGEEMVGKITLKTANDYYMANLTKHLLEHPKTLERVLKAGEYRKLMPDVVSPVRVVFGQWEKLHRARSRIHVPIQHATEQRNEYTYEKLLTLMQMYKERGLGTWKKTATGALKLTPAFGPEDAKKVYNAALQIDGLTRAGRAIPTVVADTQNRIKGIVSQLSPMQKQLLYTHNNFFDHLYAEHMVIKIPQLFEGIGLTAAGSRRINFLLGEITPEIGRIFSKAGQFSHKEKTEGIKGILEVMKKELKHPALEGGKHPWFKAEGAELNKLLTSLDEQLTLGGERGFVGYLENYTARIRKTGSAKATRWENDLVGKMKAFYTKERKSIYGFDVVEDLGSMLSARIRAQANELFLYPKVEQAITHARKLPNDVKEFTDHYVARILGRTSNMDEKMARFLERSIGRIGGKQFWTPERVGNLARRCNDLAILGGLGFKPFAVMRDMFQPLLTVPADLGGLKGMYHLLRGYHGAFTRSDIRKYVRDIGAITEFAPELYLKQRILPFEKGAGWDKLRDAGLWLYSFSDRGNRYVTGAAAFQKWDDVLGKVGKETLLTEKGLAQFSKRVGLSGRYPWMKAEVEQLLSVGRFDDAKKVFVRDVVEDCQFLYRTTEAPIVSQKYGALGKTGFLFQSWWANYGSLLEKWMRTGDSGVGKANRMFTWMISSAMAAQLMEPLWGTGTALRTTFTGPFPLTMNKYMLPPAFAPIYEFANMIGVALPQHLWKGEPEKLVDSAKSLLRSFTIFVPGGLQLEQVRKGVTEEGWTGLAKSIIRYNQAKDYRPLWGLGQEKGW